MSQILTQIQALSDERQLLWRKAGRRKFSDAWWVQHDRIKAIGKQLERLWHIHRSEVAASQVWEVLPTDRINLATFDDFHHRRALTEQTTWLVNDGYVWIEAEAWMRMHYPSGLRKQTKQRSVAPRQRPDLRKRACIA